MEKKKESRKKPVTKKKTVTVKKTTSKKSTTSKKKPKKKAFTLIELLAVIIILGVIMLVAIPSVTKYISSSRKQSYISTAKSIINGARTKVNEGSLEMYDTAATYYIPASCIPTEKGGRRTPYGDLDKAYIIVTYDGRGYNYYWVSTDTAQVGIRRITGYDKLDVKDIETSVKSDEISPNIGIDGRKKIIEFSEDCSEKNAETNAANMVDANGEEIVVVPISFATDDWSTIATAVRNNETSVYHVGDTKQVDLGELGIHTVRIANMSTPSDCSAEGFSQTACGFVVEFADIITKQRMNPFTQNGNVNGDGNRGGWEYSEMRQHVSTTIYNSLPQDLKNVIIDTFVVSSHGAKDTANFETIDKLYLLSAIEVDGRSSSGYSDRGLTRQLDYYSGYTSNTRMAIKQYQGSNYIWCFRSAEKSTLVGRIYYNTFYGIRTSDGWVEIYGACSGASPAFRIG